MKYGDLWLYINTHIWACGKRMVLVSKLVVENLMLIIVHTNLLYKKLSKKIWICRRNKMFGFAFILMCPKYYILKQYRLSNSKLKLSALIILKFILHPHVC